MTGKSFCWRMVTKSRMKGTGLKVSLARCSMRVGGVVRSGLRVAVGVGLASGVKVAVGAWVGSAVGGKVGSAVGVLVGSSVAAGSSVNPVTGRGSAVGVSA